ncbi:cytokine-like protein 1 [Denticeps clupeoides]|uniref:Cytokine-like protein 1 n=1 Tax=Denticeps clupeoides TaxID=299321 RepID=A0AAY4B8Q1_9TELE|nr:cytokine-like protein 1 [Denticeps clupeoides]
MKSGLVLLLLLAATAAGAPPTCYSRMLELSKEIMEALDRLHRANATKACAAMLPKMFLDLHNSCFVTKLRDFLYVVENHPTHHCQRRPRIQKLRDNVQKLYSIVNRVCYRELVYHTSDCEALETGYTPPRYSQDRLQILEER